MIEPKPHPTRRTHRLASLARWSLGVILSLWLLVAAVWGVLHGWIVPRISEWRPELQSLASRTLGIPVTIGSLSARRDGIIPRFELGDVVLHDPASGREALHLSRVVIGVSAHSLLTLGVEQIYVEAPDLTIRRAADGHILIAGIAMDTRVSGNNSAADWIFSQPEIALRHGRLQWVDELRQTPPLLLTDVDLVLRNKAWSHSLRLDATPPEAWGQRFTVMGNYKEPLLSVHEGQLDRWSGQTYLDFAQIDLSQAGPYIDTADWQLQQGRGALRAWVEIGRGKPVGLVADVSIESLALHWKDRPQPLQLQALQGRLRVREHNGYQASVENFSFTADDGLQWPRGNLSLNYLPMGTPEQGPLGERGEIQADEINLAIAAQLLQRLPVPQALQDQMAAITPSGLLRQWQLSWRGPPQAPLQFKSSGRVEKLTLHSQPSPEPASYGVPGMSGISGRFSFDQDSGEAQLSKDAGVARASLSFPGVFELPEIPFQQLDATVRWQTPTQGQGRAIKVQVPQLSFANEDTAGQAQAQWQTGAGTAAQPQFPGVLDLQGQLSRANGARIYRYLPLDLGGDALRYVREAVASGQAGNVKFKVKGELDLVPFEKPGQGEFHIRAQVRDVNYRYVPAHLLGAGEKPWPALTRMSGELVFDRNSMAVRNAKGFLGDSAVVVDEAQASIADWNTTEVKVAAKAHGALSEMLGVVQGSALAALTGHVLDESRATGSARLNLDLFLPTLHMERSKVKGELQFAGNTVNLMPSVPPLTQVRGAVQFSDTGFALAGVQATALGGDVRLEGGMKPEPVKAGAGKMGAVSSPVQIRIEGTATAQGLQEAKELGLLPQLARHMQGQARYGLQLRIAHSEPDISFQSDLQGMAVNLPAPFAKAGEAALPLRVSRLTAPTPEPGTDQISVRWGDAAAALLERDISGAQTRLLRGSVELLGRGKALAAPTINLPASGLQARVELPVVDVDAWEKLLSAPAAAEPAASAAASPTPAADWLSYLPRQLTLKTGELKIHGRQLHDVSAQLTHAGSVWQSQVDARELAGQIEYRQATLAEPSGQLIARLSRLVIPDAEADAQLEVSREQSSPRELPALQISVDNFLLGKRSLGRLDVQARNQLVAGSPGLREWQLSRFDITTPEAGLTAKGRWALRAGDSKHPGHTQMQFQLNLRDVGKLLNRFEMPGVVANGQGKMQGEISWTGSPMTPDFKTMSGGVHLDVQKGQFLKAEPGLAKLLGVLSLQALPRRLTLDFRDVFRNGFSFDFMRGDVNIQNGIARTNNMQMKGVNAAVLLEGSADIDKETQDLHVVVVPEINALTASLVATAINPMIGLGSFLAQMVLRGPLIAAATKEFQIRGSWDDPQVIELPRRAAKGGGAADAATPKTEEAP
ncbi:YhdP family protein [Comamonas sp.]|uniref:YhdP family protein n=1 Tax=Comamonas sp. TaxID=34028 RepID=UPI003A8CFA43